MIYLSDMNRGFHAPRTHLAKRFFIVILLALATWSCENGNDLSMVAPPFPDDDIFHGLRPKIQKFELLQIKDTLLIGHSGTRIYLSPHCLVDQKGEPAQNGTITLVECLEISEMLRAGLSTSDGNKLLQTDGMVYINAYNANGPLSVSPDYPVYVEIPTPRMIPSVQVYKGVQNKEGQIRWENPKDLVNDPLPVPLSALNFYPEGFEDQLAARLPFNGHLEISDFLLDSVYASLSVNRSRLEFIEDETIKSVYYTRKPGDEIGPCEIDPAMVLTLNSNEFEETIIATREFEERLALIFKTCKPEILMLYISNLDLNLFEIDSMAAIEADSAEHRDSFRYFQSLGIGKVNVSRQNAMNVANLYRKKLKENRERLKNNREKQRLQRAQEEAEHEAANEELAEILQERERLKMTAYGFELTDFGWINIDRGVGEKDWAYRCIEVKIAEKENVTASTMVHIVIPSLGMIERLRSKSTNTFATIQQSACQVPLLKKGDAHIIAISVEGEQYKFGRLDFGLSEGEFFSLNLQPCSAQELEAYLSPFDNFSPENRLEVELKALQASIQREIKVQDQERDEMTIQRLQAKAFPCCYEIPDGEVLFERLCSACHRVNDNATGPPLKGNLEQYGADLITQFLNNPLEYLTPDNEHFSWLLDHWVPTSGLHNSILIRPDEVDAIYQYVESYKE